MQEKGGELLNHQILNWNTNVSQSSVRMRSLRSKDTYDFHGLVGCSALAVFVVNDLEFGEIYNEMRELSMKSFSPPRKTMEEFLNDLERLPQNLPISANDLGNPSVQSSDEARFYSEESTKESEVMNNQQGNEIDEEIEELKLHPWELLFV